MVSFLDVMRVISTITAVLVAVSPAPDYWKIYKTRSTGVSSILPVVMIFCNCYVWVLYAYLVENFLPLFANCCFGMFTSVVFGGVYYRWSNDRAHIHKVCTFAFVALAAYTVYYILGASDVTNQSQDSVEKVLGVLSDIVSLVLYASPLETMKKVIQTKDATTLPIIISAIFLTNTTVWTIFAIADDDVFVTVPNAIASLLALLALGLQAASAMKQSWVFESEDRSHFLIERFGFGPSGRMDVSVSQVAIESPENAEEVQAGLLFVHQDDLWETMALLDDAVGGEDLDLEDPMAITAQASGDGDKCALQLQQDSRWIDLTDAHTWNVSRGHQQVELKGREGGAHNGPLSIGFYYIFYAQCTPGLKVSFHMDAMFKNGANDFLSAGDAPLPIVYLATSFLFLCAAAVWWRCLVVHLDFVQRVHWLMAVLVTVKTVALFAEAMRVYYMKQNGDTLTAWTAVTYTFMSLKGILLFSVLLLIGTGWSLLKPHLSHRDKSVLSLVLVLQVVSNTAQILQSETSVGTRAWVSWRDILLLTDVACCAAVLFPIVWSIRELRVAAATDGKAFINLQKLTQFRSFYLLVICYIYVTRLVLQLLQASLPYDATWIAVAVSELAALVFFTVTGYRFRPLPLNPYLEVPMHEDDLEEFALDDDEEDLDFRTIQRSEIRKFAYGAPVRTKASYAVKSNSSERTSYAKKRSGSLNNDV